MGFLGVTFKNATRHSSTAMEVYKRKPNGTLQHVGTYPIHTALMVASRIHKQGYPYRLVHVQSYDPGKRL